MHSFLSKVFGRKKEDKETSPTTLRPGELLDGKFEAVSPNVSPGAANFLELDNQANAESAKDKDKDIVFSLFRAKSRPSPPEIRGKRPDTLPHLSLDFSAINGDSNGNNLLTLDHTILSDAIIGRRRLNPLEAIVLIRACSQAIVATGLETLGIMHPHWYSASPEVQRRLISQFIHSMEPKTPPTAFSPNSALASSFESEIECTHSPHDIAAVLRWGLRHLRLDGDSFGTDDGWYKAFLEAEAAAGYPPKAFTQKLAPLVPKSHFDLLTATLELFSYLAAHSEANGTSGSKLSKIFGLWLLTARQVEDKDDWQTFYTRWETTGRMLEHLFLSRIKDESSDHRTPVRLLELVRRYPYTQGLSSPTTDLQLLPRPQFTTQYFDAFFVRIEVELPSEKRKPKLQVHPLNILADAFSTKVEEGELAGLWGKITAASKDGSNPSPLSNIFADETIRLLSIIPDKSPNKAAEPKSPTFSLLPVSPSARGRSFSAGDNDKPTPVQHLKSATEPPPASAISAITIGSDWAQFSSSGFLDTSPAIVPLVSTLFDTDVEKTQPPPTPLSRKSSKRTKAASGKSVDFSAEPVKPIPEVPAEEVKEEPKGVVRATKLQVIQIDEAFIDFWSDSLLDPVTATWPTFIICKFKSTLVPKLQYTPAGEDGTQKTLKWLVLEQVITAKPAPVLPASPSVSVSEAARPVSPALSTSGRTRFSFWSMSRTASSSSQSSQKGKKKEKQLNVGEMGEVIEEESTDHVKSVPARIKSFSKSRKSTTEKPKDPTRKSIDVSPKAVVTPSAPEAQAPAADKAAPVEASESKGKQGESIAVGTAVATEAVVDAVVPISEVANVETTVVGSSDKDVQELVGQEVKAELDVTADEAVQSPAIGTSVEVEPVSGVAPVVYIEEKDTGVSQVREVTAEPVAELATEPVVEEAEITPVQPVEGPATASLSVEPVDEVVTVSEAQEEKETEVPQSSQVTAEPVVEESVVGTDITTQAPAVLSPSAETVVEAPPVSDIIAQETGISQVSKVTAEAAAETVAEPVVEKPDVDVEATPVQAIESLAIEPSEEPVSEVVPVAEAIGGSEVAAVQQISTEPLVESLELEAAVDTPIQTVEAAAIESSLVEPVAQAAAAAAIAADVREETQASQMPEVAAEAEVEPVTEPVIEESVVDAQGIQPTEAPVIEQELAPVVEAIEESEVIPAPGPKVNPQPVVESWAEAAVGTPIQTVEADSIESPPFVLVSEPVPTSDVREEAEASQIHEVSTEVVAEPVSEPVIEESMVDAEVVSIQTVEIPAIASSAKLVQEETAPVTEVVEELEVAQIAEDAGSPIPEPLEEKAIGQETEASQVHAKTDAEVVNEPIIEEVAAVDVEGIPVESIEPAAIETPATEAPSTEAVPEDVPVFEANEETDVAPVAEAEVQIVEEGKLGVNNPVISIQIVETPDIETPSKPVQETAPVIEAKEGEETVEVADVNVPSVDEDIEAPSESTHVAEEPREGTGVDGVLSVEVAESVETEAILVPEEQSIVVPAPEEHDEAPEASEIVEAKEETDAVQIPKASDAPVSEPLEEEIIIDTPIQTIEAPTPESSAESEIVPVLQTEADAELTEVIATPVVEPADLPVVQEAEVNVAELPSAEPVAEAASLTEAQEQVATAGIDQVIVEFVAEPLEADVETTVQAIAAPPPVSSSVDAVSEIAASVEAQEDTAQADVSEISAEPVAEAESSTEEAAPEEDPVVGSVQENLEETPAPEPPSIEPGSEEVIEATQDPEPRAAVLVEPLEEKTTLEVHPAASSEPAPIEEVTVRVEETISAPEAETESVPQPADASWEDELQAAEQVHDLVVTQDAESFVDAEPQEAAVEPATVEVSNDLPVDSQTELESATATEVQTPDIPAVVEETLSEESAREVTAETQANIETDTQEKVLSDQPPVIDATEDLVETTLPSTEFEVPIIEEDNNSPLTEARTIIEEPSVQEHIPVSPVLEAPVDTQESASETVADHIADVPLEVLDKAGAVPATIVEDSNLTSEVHTPEGDASETLEEPEAVVAPVEREPEANDGPIEETLVLSPECTEPVADTEVSQPITAAETTVAAEEVVVDDINALVVTERPIFEPPAASHNVVAPVVDAQLLVDATPAEELVLEESQVDAPGEGPLQDGPIIVQTETSHSEDVPVLDELQTFEETSLQETVRPIVPAEEEPAGEVAETDITRGELDEVIEENQREEAFNAPPVVESVILGADADAPFVTQEQPLLEASSELINIASSVPAVVPITIPEDSSAEALIDIPPVPLVEAPSERVDSTHVTVLVQDEAPKAIQILEAAPDSEVVDTHLIPSALISAGSIPGPQVSLNPAVEDESEEGKAPIFLDRPEISEDNGISSPKADEDLAAEEINPVEEGSKDSPGDPIELTPEQINLQENTDDITDSALEHQPDITHEATEDLALEGSSVTKADDQPEERSHSSSVEADVPLTKDLTDAAEPGTEDLVEEGITGSKPEMVDISSASNVQGEPASDGSSSSVAIVATVDTAQDIVDVVSDEKFSDAEESHVSSKLTVAREVFKEPVPAIEESTVAEEPVAPVADDDAHPDNESEHKSTANLPTTEETDAEPLPIIALDDTPSVPIPIDQADAEVLVPVVQEPQAEESIAAQQSNDPTSETQLEQDGVEASTEDQPDEAIEDPHPAAPAQDQESVIASETPIQVETNSAETTADTQILTDPTILGEPVIAEEVPRSHHVDLQPLADESGISQEESALEASPGPSVPLEPPADVSEGVEVTGTTIVDLEPIATVPDSGSEEAPVEELASSPTEAVLPTGPDIAEPTLPVEEPADEVPNPPAAEPVVSFVNSSVDAQPIERTSVSDEITEPEPSAIEERPPAEPTESLNAEEDAAIGQPVPSVDLNSSDKISVREQVSPTPEESGSSITEPPPTVQDEAAADEASATPTEAIVSDELRQELSEEFTFEEPESTTREPNGIAKDVKEVHIAEAPEVAVEHPEPSSHTTIAAIEEDRAIDHIGASDEITVEETRAAQSGSTTEESIAPDNEGAVEEFKPIDATVEVEDQVEEAIEQEPESTSQVSGEAVPAETDEVDAAVVEAKDVPIDDATETITPIEDGAIPDEEATIEETAPAKEVENVKEPGDEVVSEEANVTHVTPEQNITADETTSEDVQQVSIPVDDEDIPKEAETLDDTAVVEDANVSVETTTGGETELTLGSALVEATPEETPAIDIAISDESQDAPVEEATFNAQILEEPPVEEAGSKPKESIPVDDVVLQEEKVIHQASADDHIPAEGTVAKEPVSVSKADIVETVSEDPKAEEAVALAEVQDLPSETVPVEDEKSELIPESLPVDEGVAPQETFDDTTAVEAVEDEKAELILESLPGDDDVVLQETLDDATAVEPFEETTAVLEEPALASEEATVESAATAETIEDTAAVQDIDEPIDETTAPETTPHESAPIDDPSEDVQATEIPVEDADIPVENTIIEEPIDETALVEETTAEEPEVILQESLPTDVATEATEASEVSVQDVDVPVESTIVEEPESTPEDTSPENEVKQTETVQETVAIEDEKLDGETVEEPESTPQEPVPVELVSDEPKLIESVDAVEDNGAAVEEVSVEESHSIPEANAVDDAVLHKEGDVGSDAVEEPPTIEETTAEEAEITPEHLVPVEAVAGEVASGKDSVVPVGVQDAPVEAEVAEPLQEHTTSVSDEVVLEDSQALDSTDAAQEQSIAVEQNPAEYSELSPEAIKEEDEAIRNEAEAVDATLSVSELDEMLPSPSTDLSTIDPDASFATSGPFALESVMSSIGEEAGDDLDDSDDSVLGVDSKVSEVEDDVLNGTAEGNGHLAETDVSLSEPVAEPADLDSSLVEKVAEQSDGVEVATNGEIIDGLPISEVSPLDSEPVFDELNQGNGQYIDKSAIPALPPHEATAPSLVEVENSKAAEVAVDEP